MCVSLSNYTSSMLHSAFNYILFVPLGAEGPVNCLELCAASPCSVTRLHSRWLIRPRRRLRGWWVGGRRQLRHYLPSASTTDKPIEIAAARPLWGGIKCVCSCLIRGPDAGINKLWEEGSLMLSLTPFSQSFTCHIMCFFFFFFIIISFSLKKIFMTTLSALLIIAVI